MTLEKLKDLYVLESNMNYRIFIWLTNNFHVSTFTLRNICTHLNRMSQYFRNNKPTVKMQRDNRCMLFRYDGRLFRFQGLFCPANSVINHPSSFPFTAGVWQGFSFTLKNYTWWRVSWPYSCSLNTLYPTEEG